MQLLEITILDPHDVPYSQIIQTIQYYLKILRIYEDFLQNSYCNEQFKPGTRKKFTTEINLIKSLIFHLKNYVNRKEYKIKTVLDFAQANHI